MQFIIVADDDLARLGRQLAHLLSLRKERSAAFWTVKHYKDNEAQIVGKQPLIIRTTRRRSSASSLSSSSETTKSRSPTSRSYRSAFAASTRSASSKVQRRSLSPMIPTK
jgi:hypothetical protein